MYIWIFLDFKHQICLWICVQAVFLCCVCVWKREREREREGEGGGERPVDDITYGTETSHTWMSDGSRTNTSCHTHVWVKSSARIRHVTLMENVMLPLWMSHNANTNESCHTHVWFKSSARMRHVTLMEYIMPPLCMSYVAYTNESCPHMYESRMCMAWLPHECVMSHTWTLLNVAPMSEPYRLCEWVMSHICMSLIYIRHENHVNESCHTNEMTQYRPHERVLSMSHVPHMCEPYIYTPWKSRKWVMSHTWNVSIPPLQTSLVAHTNESCPTYVWPLHIYAMTAWLSRKCIMSHTWNTPCRS